MRVFILALQRLSVIQRFALAASLVGLLSLVFFVLGSFADKFDEGCGFRSSCAIRE